MKKTKGTDFKKMNIIAMVITEVAVVLTAAYTFAFVRPPLIAHMGLSAKAPMNTVEAFEEAVKAGCAGIETDVRLTSDGTAVCFHDRSLDKTTSGTGDVSDHTWAELQSVRYTKAEGLKKYPDASIPKVSEYLDICKKNGVLAVIDVKYGQDYKKLIDAVYEEVSKRNIVREVVFQCDGISVLKYVKEKDPEARTWYLVGRAVTFNDISDAVKSGCEGINTDHLTLDNSIVMHEAGLKVCVYTVNSALYMKEVIGFDPDFIMTDGCSDVIR